MSGSMDVRMLATEELTPALRRSIIDVCIAAHDEQGFRDLFTFIPSGGRHFLAYRDGELVSHAVATTRWAQPEGHPVLRTAYVDAVSTLPACQGLGYGSAAMRALAEGVADFELGCLETERLGFYARLGWEEWCGPLAGRDGDTIIPTPDQRGVMVLRLPLTPTIDIDAGMTIERQESRIW